MDKRRMCPNCRAFVTTDDRVCPYCELQLGQRAVDKRAPADVLGGLIPHYRFTTMMILLVNTGLYLATVLYSMRVNHGSGLDLDGYTLFAFGAKYEIFRSGQWWRLITAGYLHGGLLHIGMNMWVLFDLGVQVEDVFGTSRYLVMYFLATVGGFLASSWWDPGVLSIGASAGIFGLIGAMVGHAYHERHSAYGKAIFSLYSRWIFYGLAFGIVPSLLGFSFMDNAAHIGGVATGFIAGYLVGTPRLARPAEEKAWSIAAWISLAITGWAFLQMFVFLTRAQ